MFSRLRQLLGRRPGEDAAPDAPLTRAVNKAAEIESRLPLRQYEDEARRKALARKLFLQLNRIFSNPDSVAACREQLARLMVRFARYQVLLIPPPPGNDPSGLRGLPGITGRLGSHVERLSVADPELHAALNDARHDDEDIERTLERVYWKTRWFLEALNEARVELGDVPGSGDDWFGHYRHAACASQEHQYRLELGEEPAFDSAAAQAIANAYSIYTDIVLSGAADPDREWRDYCAAIGIPADDIERRSAEAG